MRTTRLGTSGPVIGAMGFGCMGMSWGYQESTRDDDASVALIHEAIELGVTLLDTADIYGDGHNEHLISRALAGRREQAVLATKAGLVVDDLESRRMHRDGSPGHIRAAADASLKRLGTDVIDLYYLHRVDPAVPLRETWGAMSELVSAGKVRYLGLSEVSVAEAAAAHAVHPVTAVQSELSLWTRDPLGLSLGSAGGDLAGWCKDAGAALVPFAPLGRGFLTGGIDAATAFEGSDFRSVNPRFTVAARTENQRLVDVLQRIALAHGGTAAQVALAWVLAQGSHVVPIPGTRRSRHLHENVAALELELAPAELDELDALPAAAGSRY